MTKKKGSTPAVSHENQKITDAIEQYVAQGGVINVVQEGETSEACAEAEKQAFGADHDAQMSAKLEQLKGLVAKGAGVSALQYSLRMNRKEIKRLASENGLKILYSRPIRGSRASRSQDALTIDDTVAGHAMHYSTLGYTVPEIAQLLGLRVRDIWNIGQAYRFEFRNTSTVDAQVQPPSDTPQLEQQ